MKVLPSSLPGVILLEPARHEDSRGAFMETFREDAYREAGISGPFVQDNLSHSTRHVLRGLHYQNRQGKLITVVEGDVFDVAVDIRRDSAHFGEWFGVRLSRDNHRQLYIPPGFAHGFCVLSEHADVWYKTTDIYRPEEEGGVAWDDPAIGVKWPVSEPFLSERDRKLPPLGAIARDRVDSNDGPE